MRITRISINVVFSIIILVLGVVFSYVVFAQNIGPGGPTEEEIRAAGIAFPIAELGNCASKSECRDYCNDTANMGVCISFARTHGLMNEAEAVHAERFRERMEFEGGPGGCRSPVSCNAYCSDISHIEECIAFADEQGFDDPEIEDARRIAAYLRSGGEMPGGCTSEASCMEYCGDFSHARECFEFATRAGLAHEDDFEDEFGEGIPSRERFQQFITLIERGETPGGCKSRRECELYCRDSVNFEECIAFGEKMGFIGPEEAAMARRTGGVGPGGCNSHESCAAYCNDSSNQEECFRFAEEHGLIPEEELRHTKEGFVRLRQGLEQAPPEVHACLKSVLGPNIIEDIQSGNLVPGPAIGERVKGCFEKFGHRSDPRGAFIDAPPEIIACVKGKIGDTFDLILRGEAAPTPEMGDAFRVCFESVRFEREGFFGGPPGPGGPADAPLPAHVREFLRSAPPDVSACLKERLGGDLGALQRGEIQFRPEFGELIKGCFETFRPPEHRFDEERGEFFVPPPSHEIGDPRFEECIRTIVGAETFERFKRGENVGLDFEEKARTCFERKFGSSYVPPDKSFLPPSGGLEGPGREVSGLLEGLPFEVVSCVKSALGFDFLERVERGEVSRVDVEGRVRVCIEKFRSGGLLVPPETLPGPFPKPIFDPARECAEKGGTWDGRGCVSSPDPYPLFDPVRDCTEKGGIWNRDGQTCIIETTIQPPLIDLTKECAEKGGTWDGQTCIIETTIQPPLIDLTKECIEKGGTWDGSTCVIQQQLDQ